MDHVFEIVDASTIPDIGAVGGADLSRLGAWTFADPIVDGTTGSLENVTTNKTSLLRSPVDAIDVARTGDVWFEGIFQLTTSVTGIAEISFAQLADAVSSDPQGLGTLVYERPGGDRIIFRDSEGFSIRPAVSALTAAYLADPTYIAVSYTHSTNDILVYFKKSGEAEGVSAIGDVSPGTAGPSRLYVSGNGTLWTGPFSVHAFAVNRGTLTSEHRNNIYAAAKMV